MSTCVLAALGALALWPRREVASSSSGSVIRPCPLLSSSLNRYDAACLNSSSVMSRLKSASALATGCGILSSPYRAAPCKPSVDIRHAVLRSRARRQVGDLGPIWALRTCRADVSTREFTWTSGAISHS